MVQRFFAVALCLGFTSVLYAAERASPPNLGTCRAVAFEKVSARFKAPDRAYAPFVFWFWDEPLDPAKMAEMSRVMCSQGFNPGYAHARRSMVGTPDLPGDEWLGDRWFAAFTAALKQAEARKCYLGYCDEYWWPSFQAHGRVLEAHPELRAESLRWTVFDVPGGGKINVPESFFAVAAELAQPLTNIPTPPLTMGKWIWEPNGREEKHTCWFRKAFDLPEGRKVAQAILRVTVDNSYTLFLNGKKIGSGDNWKEPGTYDVAADLATGRNVLAVEGRNDGGPFGLILGLAIELDDGAIVNVQSDGSWRTILEKAAGWEQPALDDRSWTKAREICGAGEGPWGAVAGLESSYTHTTIRSRTLRVIGGGEPFSWKAPAGNSWRVYAFNKYFHPGIDGGQTNSIDPRLAKVFINLALEPYAKRLGDRLGKSIPGDFIDNEGDYGWQLAWSDALAEQYQKRYGRDLRLWMPLMLDRDKEGLYAKARWEWFDLVSDLYTDNFRAVTYWHERRGMYTTAHVWEESLPAQVNAVGDHLKFLRSLTMPGQDCLVRKCLYVHDFKEAASVAEFQGARATTELMGVAGWPGLDPVFLKQSVNAVTAWGMGHIIPHGVFTTRKLDGNPWMPDLYAESPTFPWMHLWNNFACRASFINSLGHAVPDVLLYNPLESAWILASAEMLDREMWTYSEDRPEGKQINALDRIYSKAIADLTEGRIEFLIGDRHYLAEMEVKDGRLVRGPLAFGTLVLPPLRILGLDGARKMLSFAKGGGRVYALGELPSGSVEKGMGDAEMEALMKELTSQPTFTQCPPEPPDCVASWTYGPGWQYQTDASKHGLMPLIAARAPGLESPIKFLDGAFPLLQTRRRIDGRDFFWLANNDPQNPQACKIEVSGVRGAASIWDCETGEVKPVPSADAPAGSRLSLAFKPLEAYWLVFDPLAAKGDSPIFPATILRTVPESGQSPNLSVAKPQEEVVATITGPWTVSYDAAIQPVMEHPVKPPAEFAAGTEKPLEDWQTWGLKGFSGLLDYSVTATVPEVRGRMVLDLGQVFSAAEVWVNGRSCGMRLWGPYVFDVSSALKPGENRIRVRVANLPGASYGLEQQQGLRGPVRLLSTSGGQTFLSGNQ
jgi:hypothetical protein